MVFDNTIPVEGGHVVSHFTVHFSGHFGGGQSSSWGASFLIVHFLTLSTYRQGL
jgi:hypothetical protein